MNECVFRRDVQLRNHTLDIIITSPTFFTYVLKKKQIACQPVCFKIWSMQLVLLEQEI